MPSAGLLTGRKDLEELFEALADELDRLGLDADVVMVGGAWMLWHEHRTSTRDVDSARRLESEVAEAVAAVGSRHELTDRWLNDAAAAFWPAGTSLGDCEVVYERGSLTVRTPTPEVIFAMKLYRGDPQDREDMVDLWPQCAFATPGEAVGAFRAGYPHAPEDEHLVDYVRAIAADAAAG